MKAIIKTRTSSAAVIFQFAVVVSSLLLMPFESAKAQPRECIQAEHVLNANTPSVYMQALLEAHTDARQGHTEAFHARTLENGGYLATLSDGSDGLHLFGLELIEEPLVFMVNTIMTAMRTKLSRENTPGARLINLGESFMDSAPHRIGSS
jgi:hypothetical protein